MAKRFYCKVCVGRSGDRGVYHLQALALLDGHGKMVFGCRDCGEPVEIVDVPCNHEWDVKQQHTICDWAYMRTCKKCLLVQIGTQPSIVWRDA